ncbi:MAG: tRNA (N6-isopentenyl adenosine(37)-C2)-methylthiotransferase MiaB [Deltaproteobacteria bacterium]|nr:MAG: tRNA (N6-isopentenyl adenosine(37)-C2)-methylthiotransferase MiaB [Deltaproteobacteria bacterium]
MPGKAYIHTFGCQMNEYDSARMMGLLQKMGFDPAGSPEEADVIIVNTCSVREKAEQKVYSLLGRLKVHKKRRGATIAVGGCVAQQLGEKIFEKAPYVDVVFGTHNIDRLPEMISRARGEGERVSGLEMWERPSTFEGDQYLEEGTVKAYVTIMTGCDNFCAYCIVPLVRGREYSRPSREVLDEVRRLAERGVKEVILLGQNVNSYGKKNGDCSFPHLLRQVCRIDGIERVRFVTSHPKDFSDDLVSCFGEFEKLCPHLHLPAQSGSDRILERMGRKYTRDHYLSIVEKLRKVRPDITFSSDFIVGFPGETDEDFRQTLSLIEEVRYDISFSFRYSPRPGTRAAGFEDQVPEEVKRERLIELQSLQNRITLENYRSMVGKKVEVLVEGPSKRDDNKYTGRTPCNKVVNFEAREDVKGQFITVEIVDAFSHSLAGRPV